MGTTLTAWLLSNCSPPNLPRQTITIIPRRANQPAPNLEHLILMALTLLAFRCLQLEFPQWWIGLLIGVVLVGGTLFQFGFQGRVNSGYLKL